MSEPTKADGPHFTRLHLRIGWWSLLGFLTLGIGLEWLHAAKTPWYLNAEFETRRQLWTLAHAHGVILSLVHVAFAATVERLDPSPALLRFASNCLIWAAWLMPSGFLIGGAALHDGEPGPGIYLVPIGGLLLFAGVLCAARIARGPR